MPTITKTPPSPTPAARDSVSRELVRLRDESLERWRGWAVAISEGLPPPGAREVLEVAAIVGIESPGAALEADAQALRDAAGLEVGIAAAEVEVAATLEPHGGSLQALRLKIEGLEAQARDLKSVLVVAASGGRAGHLTSMLNKLRRDNSRVFPKEARR